MAKQLLIYENATPVNRARHANLSVKTGNTYRFAAEVNSVPLMVAEFAQVANELAIVFAGPESDLIPAVLLGVRENENLLIDAEGKWQGRYVPAFLRRYPFVFSSSDDGQNFTLCVDESFDGVNSDGRGERLFDAEGEQTQYLRSVLGFLQAYQVQFQRTKALTQRLIELKLLDPMQAQFTLKDGRQITLSGFQAVNRERLKALPAEAVATLFASDDLELIYLHLNSLKNLQSTAERLGAVTSADSAATAPEPVAS